MNKTIISIKRVIQQHIKNTLYFIEIPRKKRLNTEL